MMIRCAKPAMVNRMSGNGQLVRVNPAMRQLLG
jgi:hypothetical protein